MADTHHSSDGAEDASRDAEPAAELEQVEVVEGSKSLEKGHQEAEMNDHAPEEDTVYPKGLSFAFLMVALLLSKFLAALDMTIVATAIPSINADFHNLNQAGWYGSAFFLTLAIFQGPWGKLFKYLPLRSTFCVSVFIFEMGSLACAVSSNAYGLIAGRAVQGFGASGINLGGYVILTVILPSKKIPQYFGLFGAIYSLASVVGPLLGGVFTQQLSWRWCFYINLPLGGVMIILFLMFFRNPKSATRPIASWKQILLELDATGIALVLGALICYMLALEWGGAQKQWSSASVLAMLVVSVVLLAAFAFDQFYQKERALLVTRILCQRNVASLSAFIFFLNAANFLMIYNLPIYFQAIVGSSPTESGILNLPYILTSSLAALLTGYALGKVGYFYPFLVGGSSLAVVGTALIYTLDIGSSTGQYIGYQIVLGIAVGICVQVPIIAGQGLSQKQDIAVTTAIILFAQFVSGALSLSASNSAFLNQLKVNLPDDLSFTTIQELGNTGFRSVLSQSDIQGLLVAYMAGIKAAWAVGIGLACISFLCAFIPERTSFRKKPGTVAGDQ